MTLPRIRYSRLRFYHFVDAKDQEMGTLEDVILNPETLVPTHLILGGGFFEEYMESRGKIDDIDELAPLNLIDHIDNDYIVLDAELENLNTTDKNGKIPVDGIKYSDLTKFPIADPDGPITADVYDFLFDYQDSHLLLHHVTLEEEMRKEQYLQKFELHIPISTIKIENDTIILNHSKEDIKSMIREEILPDQRGKSKIILRNS